jgi:TAT (twin-arginine translocation) pathway signal sequence
MKNDDNALGMNQHISRRDFVGGALATATAIGLSGPASAAQPSAPPLAANYYPPALQGLRGSHPGSFEAAHSVRDAGSWAAMKTGSHDTGENYDLVVVGGGYRASRQHIFFASNTVRMHESSFWKIMMISAVMQSAMSSTTMAAPLSDTGEPSRFIMARGSTAPSRSA